MLRDLKNLYHLLVATLACIFYRYPAKNLKVIGVTGTDGKTTTSHLIHHLLKSARKKVSLISSVKAVIGQKEYDTGFHVTTPDPWQIQKYLRQAVNGGSEYMVLEVTSHALDQNRVAFCNFLIGVLTNVTHEHLDYHKTYENYVESKLKLLRKSKIMVVNVDDESFKYVKSAKGKAQSAKLVTYGIKNEALFASRRVDFTPQSFPFKTKLLGEFNCYNSLAAIACAGSLGINMEIIREALLSFSNVIGRLEMVAKTPFQVIIDFAHTPNALNMVLETARGLRSDLERVINVFGCAGRRDFAKRPLMGEISARLADFTVLTAEDPRTENINNIIEQIAQGCVAGGAKEGKDFFRIPDRQEAINFAIQKLAQRKDIVVITGKGHEKSMCFGKKEYPWSDHEAVKKALVGRN